MDAETKAIFATIVSNQKDHTRKLVSLETRLFLDNGGLSLQSKINQNTNTVKLMLKGFSVVGFVILTVVGWLVFDKL